MQRRLLLLNSLRVAALAALSCGTVLPARSAPSGKGSYPFSLGVASGSPLPDSVVLWTRILHDPLNAAATPQVAFKVRWEMAEDENFRRIAAQGSAAAMPALAHSLHIDVKGLKPGRWYWYRFMLDDAVSPVGRTRTAPASREMPAALKLAVASCQHWEFGYYAAHRHITAAAPDLVAFLGDYIYEWGAYRREHPARAVRGNESFTLADYRARYAQYKSDPDLQSSHHAAAAYQAWYEHQPVRSFTDARIYERYDWGRLARFHVLDSRQYRSAQACPRPGRGGSSSVYRNACAMLADQRRTMLGLPQEQWLKEGLQGSRARWNILAQQTLMAQSSQVPIHQASDGRFWTDGWDGYPAARQRLLDALRSSGAANPLVLSGDVHTFYAAELSQRATVQPAPSNPVIATEFCGTSITSGSRPQARTEDYVRMNPHIKFGRSDRRGFMLLDVRPERTTALFQGLDNVKEKASGIGTLASFEVQAGRPGLAAR
jgi:alkaline phosphatase D